MYGFRIEHSLHIIIRASSCLLEHHFTIGQRTCHHITTYESMMLAQARKKEEEKKKRVSGCTASLQVHEFELSRYIPLLP
jgi:hypothetical protein